MQQRPVPLNSALTAAPSDDSFIDLDRLAAIVARRYKMILLSVAAVVALAAVYLLLATAVYTSATQILLDEDLAKYAEEAQPVQSAQQVDQQISSAVEILKSNEMALRVVDEANLSENPLIVNPPRSLIDHVKSAVKAGLSVFSLESTPVSETNARNGRRQKAAAYLQQMLTVERVSRSSVISVSFRSTDPQLAAVITGKYADAYLTDQLNANFDATERASLWLQERLTDLGARSQAAALEVESFKARNGLTSPRGELMSDQQLADLNSQLIIAQADVASASARYRQYQAIVEKGPESAVKNATITATGSDNSVIAGLRERYLAVEKREREVSEKFGADHPQAVALRAAKSEAEQQIFGELQQLTENYRNEFEVTQSREKSLRENIAGVTGENSQANKSLVELRGLEQKSSALKSLYQTYLQRYEEASQQQSFPIAKARIISKAGVPVSPSSPRKSMTLALAVIVGLLAGGGLTMLLEFRERFFRVGEDVSRNLDLKFLGYAPAAGTPRSPASFWRKAENDASMRPGLSFDDISRIAVDMPHSTFAETLRNAKLASDVLLQDRPQRVIGVISPLPGEGKSTVALNFARLLASMGKRTLLIDADIRNPGLSRAMVNKPENGLVEVVLGQVPWTGAVRVDHRTKLAILPVSIPNKLFHTSELLSSQGMQALIENARKMFEYVIVDLAPIAPVVDAKAFAPQADGFILVTEWGKTPVKMLRDILRVEPQIKSKILGVVLNKVDMSKIAKYSDFGASERYRAKYLSYYVDDAVKKQPPASAA